MKEDVGFEGQLRVWEVSSRARHAVAYASVIVSVIAGQE